MIVGLLLLLALWYVVVILSDITIRKIQTEQSRKVYDNDIKINDTAQFLIDGVRLFPIKDNRAFVPWIAAAFLACVICIALLAMNMRFPSTTTDVDGEFSKLMIIWMLIWSSGLVAYTIYVQVKLWQRTSSNKDYDSMIQAHMTTRPDVLRALKKYIEDPSKVSPYIWPTESQIEEWFYENDPNGTQKSELQKIVFSYRLASYFKTHIGSPYEYSRREAAKLFESPLDNASPARPFSDFMLDKKFDPDEFITEENGPYEERKALALLIGCPKGVCPSGKISFERLYDLNKKSLTFSFNAELFGDQDQRERFDTAMTFVKTFWLVAFIGLIVTLLACTAYCAKVGHKISSFVGLVALVVLLIKVW